MDIWNKCDVCGRFISYEDFAYGTATNTLVTPESLTTYETWETLCPKHIKPQPASKKDSDA